MSAADQGGPRIVTPQEAQTPVTAAGLPPMPFPAFSSGDISWQEAKRWGHEGIPMYRVIDLAHTVATEPDRTRAAVVKALRDIADEEYEVLPWNSTALRVRADAIENGAKW